MTFYEVKAKPKNNLIDLRFELSHGIIRTLNPLGQSLQYSLENAKLDSDKIHAIWIEEDYCTPPLAMEKKAVLNKYFDIIRIKKIKSKEEGWKRIKNRNSLWIMRTR